MTEDLAAYLNGLLALSVLQAAFLAIIAARMLRGD